MRTHVNPWSAATPWVVTMACALGSGCATSEPRSGRLPPPPSEEVRRNLGTVGIASGGTLPNIILQRPMTRGASAGSGALNGAMWGLGAGLEAGQGGGDFGGAATLLVWAFTIPLGAAFGAAVGDSQGLPAQQLKEADQQLRTAILEMHLEDMVREQLLQVIQAKTRHPVVAIGPPSAPVAAGQPVYGSWTNREITTVLEATALTAGLAGERAKKAPLTAWLAVRIRLVRVQDGTELYAHTWLHRSGARPFMDWAAEEGRAFREELTRTVPQLAKNIAEELFLMYVPGQTGNRKK